MKKNRFKVVVYNGDDEITQEIACKTEQEAKRQMGMINAYLDHGQYYVRIEEVK